MLYIDYLLLLTICDVGSVIHMFVSHLNLLDTCFYHILISYLIPLRIQQRLRGRGALGHNPLEGHLPQCRPHVVLVKTNFPNFPLPNETVNKRNENEIILKILHRN